MVSRAVLRCSGGPGAELRPCDVQLYPQRQESTETYSVPFTRVVYIERTDFRTEDAEDYYGLAPGKTVIPRVRYSGIPRGEVRRPAAC